MDFMYPSGYGQSYKLRTRGEHEAYLTRLNIHPEIIRRFLALCDACCAAGHPLGGGGGKRSSATQLAGFLSVHYEVATAAESDGCRHNGKYYAQKPKTIHKAPPGLSYHEGVPLPVDYCMAIDAVGDQIFMQTIAPKYGLRVFGKIDYPHLQAIELPASRSAFNRSPGNWLPLQPWPLPAPPAGAPTPPKPPAPTPTVPTTPTTQGVIVQFTSRNIVIGVNGADVRFYQKQLNYISGAGLKEDGSYGPTTAAAIKNWQTFFGLTVDGELGPKTQQSIIEISLFKG